MRTKSLTSSIGILFFLLLTGYMSTSWAASTGKMVGQVIDKASNEPLAGVNIVVEGTFQGASTDADGFYIILNMQPGIYKVQASMIGYGSVKYENISISTNQTTTLDFELGEEAVTGETIVVRGERPVVQLDISSSQKIVTIEDIQSRPLDNLEEILGAEAGINFTAGEDGQGLIVRGGSLSETDIVVDGLSTRNLRNQQANTTIALSSIQEIELLTGGFTAEYGGIRSGMVNVTTKEGSPDRYSISFDGRMSPPARKHFGPSPYGTDGPWWQVYAGPDAMTGVTQEMVDNGQYPFRFVGWNKWSQNNLDDLGYTPQQALEIWKWQHRVKKYADKPDYITDFAISGPVPFLPVTFMVSQRYEDLELAYPMSRTNSTASTTLLKLTHQISPTMKLSLNNSFTVVNGVSGGGVYDFSTGIITGSREGTRYALDNVGSGLDGVGNWMWYEGAYNPVETKQYSTGLSWNHVLSPTTFYDIQVEYSLFKTEQKPIALRDTSTILHQVGDVMLDEAPYGYSGTISEIKELSGRDLLSGGGRGQDNSKYWSVGISGGLVSQYNKYHEFKVGFELNYTEFRERREQNNDETTTPYKENPGNWSYYNSSPIQAGAYIQDKMEFEGLTANVGLRVDIMNPGENPYNLDPNFIYDQDPYGTDIFEGNNFSYNNNRTSKSSTQAYFQPRLGISHPVTETSKVFFNYGHFVQAPLADELYLIALSGNGGRVPNLEAEWPLTISYELGTEYGITDNLLVRFSGFYKDVSNELDDLTIEDRLGNSSVITLANSRYRDVRGFELRLEKRGGNWWYGWIQGEYLVQSAGLTGKEGLYEDRLKAARAANVPTQTIEPGVPSLRANLTLFTPSDFGPTLLGHHYLGGWRLNWMQEWEDGGESILNPTDPLSQQISVDVIDYYNTDILLEKRVEIDDYRFSFYMQVKNLFNYKGFPNPLNWNSYIDDLKFPHEEGENKGNDKIGEWDKDYIDLGWNTWSHFINPRDIFFGIRFNF